MNLRRASLLATAISIAACNAILGNENGTTSNAPLGAVDTSSSSSGSSGAAPDTDASSHADAAPDAAESMCASSVCTGCISLGVTGAQRIAAASDALYVRTGQRIVRLPFDANGLPNGAQETVLATTRNADIAASRDEIPSTLYTIQNGDRLIACRGGICAPESQLKGPSAAIGSADGAFVLSEVPDGSTTSWLLRQVTFPVVPGAVVVVQQEQITLQAGARPLLAANPSRLLVTTEGSTPFVVADYTPMPPWTLQAGTLSTTGLRAVAMSHSSLYFAGSCPSSAALCKTLVGTGDVNVVLGAEAPAIDALDVASVDAQGSLDDWLIASDSSGTWTCHASSCATRDMLLERCSASQFSGNADHVFFLAGERVFALQRPR